MASRRSTRSTATAAAATSRRRYDVVLVGATGDAGRACATYLARHGGGSLRWAIAGRSAEKLQRVRSQMPGDACDVIVANMTCAAALRGLAEQTTLVLTAMGPYSILGEAVVKACIVRAARGICAPCRLLR